MARPWSERRAWLVLQSYRCAGSRLASFYGGKAIANTELRGGAAALALAVELSVAKLGPWRYDPARGRAVGWMIDHPGGAYGVRMLGSGDAIIVEGPPDDHGVMPDWRSLEGRAQVPMPGESGVFELVPAKEGPCLTS